ncbi:hypothetical protein Smp_047320 [Schistosoma mansoni]|uniref:hypothetical protein n=1 Tax=Schistosoma mansoni TaxID=6183 RepID=UPI00022DCC0A|nr:hypothetical protein Smp_047320 [Schistosoma mansoni]|eukprot:XP_018654742.1 hypothetical protein Smp_047320 [Schistosoma mansoni]
MKTNTKEASTFGIKICKLSTVIEDDRLRQQNVFLTLKNIISNQLIVKKLRRKGIDQHRLHMQSWYKKNFKSQKLELKPPKDDEKNKIDEPKLKTSGSAENSEATFSESGKE